VHVGAGKLGQHVGVEAVRLAAARAIAVARGRELVGVDGDDGDAGLEQPVEDQPVRPLERDPVDGELDQLPQQRRDALLAMRIAPVLQPAPIRVDDDQPVLEALVSSGPSSGQASLALSRRWSTTTRPYELRRSTPSPTTCGRSLGFHRTRRTKGKVGL
jgi:hypothetical protein